MQKIIEFDANAGMKLCFLFALRCAIEPASEWTNEIRLVHYLRKTREVLGHYCGSGTAASCKRNSTDLRWKIVESTATDTNCQAFLLPRIGYPEYIRIFA